MKPSKLLGLGIILATIGLIWLLTIGINTTWYVENVSNSFVFIICLIMSLLMAIGGFICIIAAFDQ
jgi:hypothetical protein